MSKFFLLCLAAFSVLSASAQLSRSADSAVINAIYQLPSSRAKHMSAIPAALVSKGVYNRLDTLKYTQAVITVSELNGNVYVLESYFQQADSAAVSAYHDGIKDSIVYRQDSYSMLAKAATAKPSVVRRRNKVFYVCNHGCIRPSHRVARYLVGCELKNYTLQLFIDKQTGKITTRIVVPPKRPLYFVRRKGSGF